MGKNIIQYIFLLGMMTFITGCPPTTGSQTNQDPKAKEGPMNLAHKIETPAIPPIDAAVPGHFETASFGLG